MPSDKQPFGDKPVNAAVFIALSRIVLVLLLTLGTYHLAIGLGIYPLNENAHDKYPLAPLYYFLVCTWNRSFYFLISILPLVYLLWYDRDKLLKDNRILLADMLIWLNAAILLYQWDSLAQSFLYYAVFLVSVAIYTIANIRYKKEENKNENAFKSCFGAEADNTEDGLNRAFFYQRTVANIREALKEPQTGGTVWALYGEWGSGKTHLLNHIERKLQKSAKQNGEPEYIFCNVNLWQVSNQDELWKTVERTLEKAYGIPERIKWAQRIQDFLSSASELDARYAIAHTICKEYLYDDDAYNLEHLRLLGERNKNKRFILFFDNLERSNAKVIKELLPLLERLKRLPNLLVIASVAMQDLISNLKIENISKEQLRAHMMKLTDNIIYMPPMGDEEATQLFIKLIDKKEKELGFPTYLREYAGTAYLYFKNPREIYNVVDILINLEIRYFSEGRAHRKESQIENSIRFVELVYDLELLKVLYSDIYHALYRFCLKLKENTKITPPDDYWVNNNINIQNDTLLDVLLIGISEYTREEYLLAANMEYTNRKKLLPNLCALIVYIAYDSYNSNLEMALNHTLYHLNEYRTTDSAKREILWHIVSEIKNHQGTTRFKRYVSVYFETIKDLRDKKYPKLPPESTLEALTCINHAVGIKTENVLFYCGDLDFSDCTSLTSKLLIALNEKKNDSSLPSSDDNLHLNAVYKNKEGNIIIKHIFNLYTRNLINKIITQENAFPYSRNIDLIHGYKAFELTTQTNIVEDFHSCMKDHFTGMPAPSLENLQRLLEYLINFELVSASDPDTLLLYHSKNANYILEPMQEAIICGITSATDFSIDKYNHLSKLANQGIRKCEKLLIYPKRLPEDIEDGKVYRITRTPIPEAYKEGAELLKLWIKDKLIPTLDEQIGRVQQGGAQCCSHYSQNE